MTKKDAIKTLKELWRETNDTWYEEVYKMAINALEADRKTENSSEIPNNCDTCRHWYTRKDIYDLDDAYCELFYDNAPCKYEPKDEPQTYITEDRTQMLDRWQTYHRNTTSAVTPCSNCQEFDCYGCEYK